MINDDLKKLFESDDNRVRQTNETKKISIDGKHAEPFSVYDIDLSLLRYNRDNGRISCEMNEFSNKEDMDEMEIEKIIVDSDKQSFDKTKGDIENFGQLEAGVVTYNGLVIDGNRRFTCLRQLNRKNPSGQYNKFKAIILDQSHSKDRKIIKKLELNIQLKKEERVDYDPINKCLEAYKNINNGDFSIDEWSDASGMSVSKVKLMVEKASLISQFLKFIKKENNWRYAKFMKLDGPFEELAKEIMKLDDNTKIDKIKDHFFTRFLCIKSEKGDLTRIVRRDLKSLINNIDFFEDNLNECTNKVKKFLNENKDNEEDTDIFENIKKSLKNEIISINQIYENENRRQEMTGTKEKTKKEIFSRLSFVKDINEDYINHLNIQEKKEFIKEANEVIEKLQELKDYAESN